MATTHSKEHEEKDSNQKETKPKDKKAPGQIAAERADKGEAVPEEEQGKPTEAREWLATERERQEKLDTARFKEQYAHERIKQNK